jgi:hypothetical protein
MDRRRPKPGTPTACYLESQWTTHSEHDVALPEPWGLVLANGYKCRIRNGGSWDGRADNYVGAYSCNGNTNNVVLIKATDTGPVVNTSKPIWTVLIGPLGRPDQKFPPPTTQPVVTAYLAGQP